MADNPTATNPENQVNRDSAEIAFIDNDFVLSETVEVLNQALKALGQAGKPDEASRLAGQAYQVLRRPNPQAAERINTLMHYLARLSKEPESGQGQAAAGPGDRELDIREIPHRERHAVIFATFAVMAPGQGFVLINDHDPRPLHFQFEAEHQGQYTWDYLEQGPRTWRVRIGRTGGPATNAEQVINVLEIPHHQRHAVIFTTYARLEPGQGFVIVSDHDPRPLHYQFEAEHQGQYSWDYLEEGPRTWRVRIGRTGAAASSAEQEINVLQIPHQQRHAVIFSTFAGLQPGEGFVIVSDHDPNPLHYQFEAEHKGQYSWDYLEAGPRTWRVRIGRAGN